VPIYSVGNPRLCFFIAYNNSHLINFIVLLRFFKDRLFDYQAFAPDAFEHSRFGDPEKSGDTTYADTLILKQEYLVVYLMVTGVVPIASLKAMFTRAAIITLPSTGLFSVFHCYRFTFSTFHFNAINYSVPRRSEKSILRLVDIEKRKGRTFNPSFLTINYQVKVFIINIMSLE